MAVPVRISALPVATSVADDAVLVMVQGGGTYKVAAELLQADTLVEATGRRLLTEFGEVDVLGLISATTVINSAISLTAAAGEGLYIGPGTYYLSAQLNVVSNLDLLCHPQAEFVAYFDSTGSTGIISMSGANFQAVPDGAPTNIKIAGGQWRRFGTLSADGLTWTGPIFQAATTTTPAYYRGYKGNVIAFWAKHVELKDMWIKGYHNGRAALIGGEHWTLDNIKSYNPDNYLNLPCIGGGGTGAFRWYSGGPMVATRLYAVCGDDAFQCVPGATDSIGEDVHDVVYSDCYGVSMKARLCVSGLVVPNSFPEDLQNSLTLSIKNITFRNIRGRSYIAWAVYNTDSVGTLGTILFDDVRCSIQTNLSAEASPYVIEYLGTSATQGVGPIIARDCELLNVLEGGVRARGTKVGHLLFQNYIQPASENPDSAYLPVFIQDVEYLSMVGGRITGAVSSTKSILYLGRTDEATNVDYALLENVIIENIPSGAFGVYGPTYGFSHLDMSGCRLFPVEGVTDAGAIRFSEITSSGFIEHNDFSRMGTTPYSNTNPGTIFINNILSDATVNGILHQQATVSTSMTWDGRSQLIRLGSTASSSLETLALPSQFSLYEIPMIAVLGINNNTITLKNTGNIVPITGAENITLNTMKRLTYDYVTSKWYQT